MFYACTLYFSDRLRLCMISKVCCLGTNDQLKRPNLFINSSLYESKDFFLGLKSLFIRIFYHETMVVSLY